MYTLILRLMQEYCNFTLCWIRIALYGSELQFYTEEYNLLDLEEHLKSYSFSKQF